jgi:hypothetical protein
VQSRSVGESWKRVLVKVLEAPRLGGHR